MWNIGKRAEKVIVLLSKLSFGVYVIHPMYLTVSAWYLHRYTALPAFGVYLCAGAAAFGGAYPLYEVFRRIPVLRWCVCGLRCKK